MLTFETNDFAEGRGSAISADQDMAPDDCMEEILSGKVIAPFIPLEDYFMQTLWVFVLGAADDRL